jgi:hypothetical protein
MVTYRNKLKQESLNLAPKKSRYGTKTSLVNSRIFSRFTNSLKESKVDFLMTPYFQMWNNSSYQIQVPRSNFPHELNSYASLKTRLRSWTNTKSKWFLQITMSKWAKCKHILIEEKLWAERKKVVYKFKTLPHSYLMCSTFLCKTLNPKP